MNIWMWTTIQAVMDEEMKCLLSLNLKLRRSKSNLQPIKAIMMNKLNISRSICLLHSRWLWQYLGSCRLYYKRHKVYLLSSISPKSLMILGMSYEDCLLKFYRLGDCFSYDVITFKMCHSHFVELNTVRNQVLTHEVYPQCRQYFQTVQIALLSRAPFYVLVWLQLFVVRDWSTTCICN